MEYQALLKTLIAYYEAFAERNAARRLELLGRSMTPNAEIWGPKRVFAGISPPRAYLPVSRPLASGK